MSRQHELPDPVLPQEVELTMSEFDSMLSLVERLARPKKPGSVTATLGSEYTWLLKVGAAQSQGGEGGTRTKDAPDPTGGVVTSRRKQRVRVVARVASNHLRDVKASLEACRDSLRAGLAILDREPPDPSVLPPRSVSDDDLRKAREAKWRREKFGGGYGES